MHHCICTESWCVCVSHLSMLCGIFRSSFRRLTHTELLLLFLRFFTSITNIYFMLAVRYLCGVWVCALSSVSVCVCVSSMSIRQYRMCQFLRRIAWVYWVCGVFVFALLLFISRFNTYRVNGTVIRTSHGTNYQPFHTSALEPFKFSQMKIRFGEKMQLKLISLAKWFAFGRLLFHAIDEYIEWADENERIMHIHQSQFEIQLERTHTTICECVKLTFRRLAWFCLRLIWTHAHTHTPTDDYTVERRPCTDLTV